MGKHCLASIVQSIKVSDRMINTATLGRDARYRITDFPCVHMCAFLPAFGRTGAAGRMLRFVLVLQGFDFMQCA